jgi:hypothetical protein
MRNFWYPKAAPSLIPALLVLALAACAPAEPGLGALQESIASGQCPVEQDQLGSFLPSLPIQRTVTVAVDSAFSTAEKSAINQAINTWNDWSRGAVGREFFQETQATIRSDFMPASGQNPCDFQVPGGDGDFAVVRVTDPEVWSDLGLTSANPAATLRCRQGDELTRQVLLIRSDLVRSEQWVSVVLHELGHVIGLDHSCNSGAVTDDFASCEGLDAEHPYRVAVMYPKLSVGSSRTGRGVEVKEALKENDEMRAACLYGAPQ